MLPAERRGAAGEALEAASVTQLHRDARLPRDWDTAPEEQNMSTLQRNTAASCRRVVLSLREVHQDEPQAMG